MIGMTLYPVMYAEIDVPEGFTSAVAVDMFPGGSAVRQDLRSHYVWRIGPEHVLEYWRKFIGDAVEAFEKQQAEPAHLS